MPRLSPESTDPFQLLRWSRPRYGRRPAERWSAAAVEPIRHSWPPSPRAIRPETHPPQSTKWLQKHRDKALERGRMEASRLDIAISEKHTARSTICWAVMSESPNRSRHRRSRMSLDRPVTTEPVRTASRKGRFTLRQLQREAPHCQSRRRADRGEFEFEDRVAQVAAAAPAVKASRGTKGFVVTCFDPDATPSGLWHWVLVGLPATVTDLATGAGTHRAARERPFQVRSDYGSKEYAVPRRRRRPGAPLLLRGARDRHRGPGRRTSDVSPAWSA